MKHLLEFEEFINENNSLVIKRKNYKVSKYDGLIYFVTPVSNVDWITGDRRPVASNMNLECLYRLFRVIPTSEHLAADVDIDSNMPILYYSGSGVNGTNFLKAKNIKENNLYNKPNGMKISSNKVEFHKTFEDDSFLPNTVFTQAAAKNLNFPIVAKIANGHSGKGIEKFDTYKALSKTKNKFDLYSEYIDFNTEYRAFFLKDKILAINERVPIEEEDKTIDTIGYDEKVRFCYVDQDLNKVPFKNKVIEIANKIRKKLPIDVYSVDFVIDKDDNIWVLEINTATGIGSAKMVLVYMAIYEDYYGKKLPESYKKELTERYIYPGNSLNYPKHKKEIAKSKYAIDYKRYTLPIPKEWKN